MEGELVRPHSSYVICTCPRSGSWLLAEGLLATGLAGRPEEYFRPDWHRRHQETGYLRYQHRLHGKDPWPPDPRPRGDAPADSGVGDQQFLEAVADLGTSPNGVFGMKVHWNQLERAWARLSPGNHRGPASADLFASWLPEPKFVYLRRRDELRRAVSHYRAIRSDEWWLEVGEAPSLLRHEVDFYAVDRLRRLARMHDRNWRDFFDWGDFRPLEILYEDLCRDYQGVLSAVLDHIGVGPLGPRSIPAPRLRRQADAWSEVTVTSYSAWLQSKRGRRGSSAPFARMEAIHAN
jgi:LPS sulfotransferase NodH